MTGLQALPSAATSAGVELQFRGVGSTLIKKKKKKMVSTVMPSVLSWYYLK